MSQPLLKDPIVVSGPTRTGTGTGSVTVDKLTHFTTAQVYTLICIAKSPDTIFSVSGSLDGPVGLATVGTQFFDDDLKIFLTIQQGGTVFEVGDKFVLTVQNGTDLNQTNIDLYDELTQKNFGIGSRGYLQGDNNLRYSDTNKSAYAFVQGLKFSAVTAGANGNNLQVQTVPPFTGTAATGTLQQLHFTSQPGAFGNSITVALTQSVTPVKATTTIQNVNFQALNAGPAGNAYSVAYTTGAAPGSEVVSISGSAITIQIASGSSTPAQIVAAFNASSLVNTVLIAKVVPTGNTTAQVGPVSAQSLTGGANGSGTAGNEIVTVVGNAISVQCENGVSTFTQVKAALDASAAATALISTTISGDASTAVLSADGPVPLSGGVDPYGQVGYEKVVVSSNLIQLFLESGRSTVSSVLAAFNANTAATALATASLVGNSTDVMYSPGTLQQFTGGLSKFYSFNQHEQSDSTNFHEGNASLMIQDAVIQGRSSFSKPVEMADKLSLEDLSSESGPAVPNVQRYINRLITLGKLTVRTSDGSPVRWYNGQLLFSANILIEQRDTSVTGTIPTSNSPVSLSDGQSYYVVLNPSQSTTLVPYIGTTIDKGVFAFKICTRVGSKLHWFNGAVSSDNDVFRIGAQVDYANQIRGIVTGGGTISSDQTTIGLVSWSSPLFLRQFGNTGVVQVAAGSVTLSDGQAAYIQLDDPFVTATKTFTIDSMSADELRRTDRYWVFYRSGNIVYTRNGGDLVPGEENTLGNEISADVFQFMGSQSETDNAPSYTTAGHTATSTANRYLTDADSLTRSLKLLDNQAAVLDDQENQDRSLQLMSGGTWAWNSTTGVLTWSSAAYLMVAGLADSVNTIPAGSVTLTDGQVAYVSMNRSGAGGNLTVSVASISSAPLLDSRVIIARRVGNLLVLRNGGALVNGESKYLHAGLSDQTRTLLGITSAADSQPNPAYSSMGTNRYIADSDSLPSSIHKLDTRLGVVSDIEAQDRDMFLVEGGSWSWNLATQTLAWDSDAYIQINGLLNTRNRIATSSTTLTDGQCLYVQVNRSGATAAALTTTVDLIQNLLITDNIKVIARRIGQHVIVGQGMLLQDGQSLPLGSGGSGGTGLAVVRGLDNTDTALPTTTATSIDGLTITDGNLFLFTGLSSGNNRIYKASVSGTVVTWTLQKLGQDPTGAPTGGDVVYIQSGTQYADKLYAYSAASSSWVDFIASQGLHKNLDNLVGPTAIPSGVSVQPAVNNGADLGADTKRFGNVYANIETTNTRRMGSGVRFVEETYLDGQTLTGGGTTIMSGLSFDTTAYKALHVDYVIYDPTTGTRRTGTLYIVADGPAGSAATNATIAEGGSYTGDVGVTWDAAISGNICQVSYTATTGNKTMHCSLKKFLG